MTVSTFFHAGILVRSLEEAIPRFERVLGIEFLSPKTFELNRFIDVEHFGDDEPHLWTGRAAYSQVGPPFYELLEAKGHGVFSLDGREEGLHHLGMLVPDAQGVSGAMAEVGVNVRAHALGTDDSQTRFFFTEPASLHGVQLELIDNTSHVIEQILAEAASLQHRGRRA